MPSVPVPVVTLFILSLLLLTLYFRDRQYYRGAIRFLFACILLLAVGALRWIWPAASLMLLSILLAALLPALAWHCFSSLTSSKFSSWQLAPAAIVLFVTQCWPQATDVALFILYLSYGVALIKVGAQDGDQFIFTRIGEASSAAKMVIAAGCFLCFSGITDLLVTLEFIWHDGQFVPLMIAILQGLMLPFMALAIVLAAKTRPEVENSVSMPPPNDPKSSQEHMALCHQLENQLLKQALFLDNNLTLNLLARKSGIPARHISRAVNATHHSNVSQWINGFRIAHAQHLLQTTDLPITDVMMESGFSTKSNFNREFLRISGMTPSQFRQ